MDARTQEPIWQHQILDPADGLAYVGQPVQPKQVNIPHFLMSEEWEREMLKKKQSYLSYQVLINKSVPTVTATSVNVEGNQPGPVPPVEMREAPIM